MGKNKKEQKQKAKPKPVVQAMSVKDVLEKPRVGTPEKGQKGK